MIFRLLVPLLRIGPRLVDIWFLLTVVVLRCLFPMPCAPPFRHPMYMILCPRTRSFTTSRSPSVFSLRPTARSSRTTSRSGEEDFAAAPLTDSCSLFFVPLLLPASTASSLRAAGVALPESEHISFFFSRDFFFFSRRQPALDDGRGLRVGQPLFFSSARPKTVVPPCFFGLLRLFFRHARRPLCEMSNPLGGDREEAI